MKLGNITDDVSPHHAFVLRDPPAELELVPENFSPHDLEEYEPITHEE